ncbi:MAG: glycosyltransferase family 2 protein, partial [Flavobacteriaceae bacterium]|nr:glycosyltransferase family 2 protein [Flavobacteriaceae bacterium]
GIELSVGKYLTFIDADDYWFPTFLEENLKRINQTQGFLCSSYEMYNEALTSKIGNLIVPIQANYNSILKTNTISCLTAFIDIEKLGKEYMPEIRYRQDMGLWIKYLKKISYIEGIQECLAIYRIRENSHSRSKFNLLKHQWFFYREVAQLNWIKSLYFFNIWVYYGLRKYYI